MGYDRLMARYTTSDRFRALTTGPNLREGLAAFVEKRPPRWVDAKL